MADESLFERQRGDPRRGDVPDIDQVFSRAVEDQLEEQRELNRLVQETTERLSGLDEGLRSFRDQTTSSLTALRGELHEDVARVAETVHERTRQLAEELDRLRSTTTDHQVRLVQLAEATGAAIDAIEAKHSRIADELADVGAQLRADDPSESELVVAALDRFEVSFGSRLDERVAALSHRLGRLHDRITAEDEVDLGQEIGRLHQRIDLLQEQLRSSVREAAQRGSAARDEAHERLAERLREEVRQDVVAALRPILEEQGTAVTRLEESLARSSERLVAQADQDREIATSERAEIQEGMRSQRSALDEVRQRLSGLDALHRRLDVLEDVHRRVGALERIPEQLDELGGVPERLRVLDAVQERLETLDVVQERLDTLDAVQERLGTLDAVQERLGTLDAVHERLGTLDAVQERLDTLDAVHERLGTLDAVHERLGTLDAMQERLGTLDAVHERLETLDVVQERLVAFDDRLTLLDGHLADQSGAIAELTRDQVEALGRLADETAAVGPDLAARLRSSLTPIADDLVDLQDQLAVLRASSTGDEEALEELRAQLSEVIGTRLEQVRSAATEQGDVLEEALRSTRDAVEAHRERVAADLREDRARLEERVGALLEAVETRLDDVDRAMRSELPDALERQRTAVTETLQRQEADLTGSLERQQAGLVEALQRQYGELTEGLRRQREELGATISEPLGDATERLRAAQEELRAAAGELGALPGDVDEQVVAGVDRAVHAAREEAGRVTGRVETAVERLDETQQRLDALETSLVAYLEARDARLEEERMQVLRDLVEEFAQGLSRRDRRRLARRLDDVRERVGVAPSRPVPDHDEPDAPSREEPPPAEAAGRAEATGEWESDAPRGLLAALLGDPETEGSEPPGGTAEEAGEVEPSDRTVDAPAAPEAADEDEVEVEDEVDGHPCPECGFIAKNAGGLASHRRTHA